MTNFDIPQMPSGLVRLLESPPLEALLEMRPQFDLAVVGGAVRDAILERPHPDLDLCVATDPARVARQLKQSCGGTWFRIDPHFGVVRSVLPGNVVVDIASRQGSWVEDLGRRDLTINAMAVLLIENGSPIAPRLLDPTGGLDDLARRMVRAVARECLDQDPLRALRVFRFAATLGFEIDAQTYLWACEMAPRLAGVAIERTRDELLKLLSMDSQAVAGGLVASQLLDSILPGADARGLAALELLVEDPQAWAPGSKDYLVAYLDQPVASGHSRRSLLALYLLTNRAGALEPGFGDRLRRRLRLSGREGAFLSHLEAGLPHFKELAATGKGNSDLSMFRLIRDAKDAAPAVALAAMALEVGTRAVPQARGLGAARRVLEEAWHPVVSAPRPVLVRGDQLSTVLGLAPGPQIAELLSALAEAQAVGAIETPTQALDLARLLVAQGQAN